MSRPNDSKFLWKSYYTISDNISYVAQTVSLCLPIPQFMKFSNEKLFFRNGII